MKMQDREEARIAWTARWRWAHDVNRVIRWGPCRGSRQCGGRQNAEVFAELRTGNYEDSAEVYASVPAQQKCAHMCPPMSPSSREMASTPHPEGVGLLSPFVTTPV
eukprot:CAMPEP_0172180032 /NCGR_PEP_ID=MMETSP1050-20130122/16968_1 /TAXON_ID=233186 /ORGANISM="Cryptomonas curvata, Strain CCAP979/52" /LENGTH=105 /DNA_ID=CAMNT_0012853021 /DNA_START=581 /DNA_END=898 /DNA_ORIENTATION=-